MSKPIPDTFVCGACGELRDFYNHAVLMAVRPEDADYVIAGMPCVASGFCEPCLEEHG